MVQDSETEPVEEDRQSSENPPTSTVTPTPEPKEELVVVEVYSDSGTFVEDAFVILEDSHGNLYEAVLEKDSLGNQKYQVTVLTGSYVIKVSSHGYFSVSKEEIVYALDAIQNPMILYDPVYSDGEDTLYVMDQISDKKNKEENWVEHLSLSEAMKQLSKREHEIIALRFFEGKTQMEVAGMIGISQAQVSRLEKNALNVMKRFLLA